LQASASGARDITLLEIHVDGLLVASTSSPDSAGVSLLTGSKTWAFQTPGDHQVSALAYTAEGRVSEPASVSVSVLAPSQETPTPDTTTTATATETSTPTETPTLTPEPSTTPTPLPPPVIEYFQAQQPTIDLGACTTLEWGRVDYATEASIEPDVGGVATPGSTTVCPAETTTYRLTARGPGGTSTASVTVTVADILPDLLVESITFEPNPPVMGQDTNVRIVIRNIGQGNAGAFNWDWQAGSDAVAEAFFDGRVPGLGAGEATVVSVIWNPGNTYDSLPTLARLDTAGEVAERDENNNQLAVTVSVVPGASQPETLSLTSEPSLDGYWLNDGSGSNDRDVLVGNGEFDGAGGEVISRGFLSFDLAAIPAGATIESVQLRFFQIQIHGSPYEKLGNLVLERVAYSSLGDDAYSTPALDSATLAQQPSPNEWYVVSDPTISTWVQSTLADGRTRFQLRLRFSQEADGDGQDDWISIESGEGSPAGRNAPQLIVVYRP
jgi:hypothetical protein